MFKSTRISKTCEVSGQNVNGKQEKEMAVMSNTAVDRWNSILRTWFCVKVFGVPYKFTKPYNECFYDDCFFVLLN